ncbi:hypothetical protein [Devosia faecipullorum]|uniref:hypothetical protein n=1 Tax=Devosia faecipullorum TaxID=2755039 RepID=UPI00187B82F4|nr:hypothetical protein [Devosia faecipullorum]MBE7731458.1 hypothetical protein [Devosia faecipullorum]
MRSFASRPNALIGFAFALVATHSQIVLAQAPQEVAGYDSFGCSSVTEIQTAEAMELQGGDWTIADCVMVPSGSWVTPITDLGGTYMMAVIGMYGQDIRMVVRQNITQKSSVSTDPGAAFLQCFRESVMLDTAVGMPNHKAQDFAMENCSAKVPASLSPNEIEGLMDMAYGSTDSIDGY